MLVRNVPRLYVTAHAPRMPKKAPAPRAVVRAQDGYVPGPAGVLMRAEADRVRKLQPTRVSTFVTPQGAVVLPAVFRELWARKPDHKLYVGDGPRGWELYLARNPPGVYRGAMGDKSQAVYRPLPVHNGAVLLGELASPQGTVVGWETEPARGALRLTTQHPKREK